MSNGPCLIFDKSTLQSLNPDEAGWLDNFFLTNITPIFYIETLADLEKKMKSGRTVEEIVGSLAYKTPDMGSQPNVHHATLIEGELIGGVQIEMDGRPVVSGGVVAELDGKTGLVVRPSPEADAFQRWQRREFLDLERTIAKRWRRALSNFTWPDLRAGPGKPTNVGEVRRQVDELLGRPDQETCFRLGLALLNVSPAAAEQVLSRWRKARQPPVREFAPYFTHVVSVELFFYLCVMAGLVSRDRPSHRVDLTYLYYLPFCDVFTSSDKLHALTVPQFLRDDQTFVPGPDLKSDLGKLDGFYSSLPPEVIAQGVFAFATYPPRDGDFLVARLWDTHRSGWRQQQEEAEAIFKSVEISSFGTEVVRFAKESTAVSPTSPHFASTPDTLVVERRVYPRKGKWQRFSPEVLAARSKDREGE